MMDTQELLSRYDYAIIDRHAVWNKEAYKNWPLVPLIPRLLRSDADKMPALLPLEKEASWFPELAENLEAAARGDEQCLLSLLLNPMPDARQIDLENHLSVQLVVYHKQGRLLLRYFDFRVFPHIVRRVLAAPHRAARFYGPVLEWACRFDGRWITFPEVEGECTRTPYVRAYIGSLRPEEHGKIKRLGAVNTALHLCRVERGRPWNDWPEYETAAEIADRAVQMAKDRYGLTAWDDIVSFAGHAVEHSEDFHFHPLVQDILRAAQGPEGGYAGRAAVLNQEQWTRIEAEALFSDPRFLR